EKRCPEVRPWTPRRRSQRWFWTLLLLLARPQNVTRQRWRPLPQGTPQETTPKARANSTIEAVASSAQTSAGRCSRTPEKRQGWHLPLWRTWSPTTPALRGIGCGGAIGLRDTLPQEDAAREVRASMPSTQKEPR